MDITITTKYDCDYEDTVSFLKLMDAVRFAEKKAKNPPNKAVSIMLKGPEGEREFIKT